MNNILIMKYNNDLINRYLDIWKKYRYNLDNKIEDFKKTNELSSKLLEIKNVIDKEDNLLEIYKNIILINYETLGGLALHISIYENDLGKKLYEYWYNLDNEKNFVGKYILEDWDNNLIEWNKKYHKEKEKYEKWKILNKEKYNKIIKELNLIIGK